MITNKEKRIEIVKYGSINISAIYQGARLVWQAVRSCFGAGKWVNDKPWINEESWKN